MIKMRAYVFSSLFVGTLLVLGCKDTSKPDSSTPDTGCVDLDGDGWCGSEDCDDNDSTTNPGSRECDYCLDERDNDCDGEVDEEEDLVCADGTSAEICDGVDNDCDGEIDDGVTATFYRDYDGDGYGQSNKMEEACQASETWVPDPGDCDDADPLISPAATEICDSVDNNCDGDIDEGCIGLADAGQADMWAALLGGPLPPLMLYTGPLRPQGDLHDDPQQSPL